MIKNNINKKWVANGTTNVLLNTDEEFLDLARKAGCVEWFVGFESVSQEALNGIKKTHNKVEDFEKMIKRVHKYDMTVQAGGIIVGFDEDTPDIFDTTLQKINELDIDVMEINILTPYPGTPLFERLDKANRIFTKDWSKYNQVEVVYEPKNMTVKELYEGTRKVAKEYCSWSNIIKRNLKIFKTSGIMSGLLPAGTNINFRRYDKPTLCNHCEDAPCQKVCPSGATYTRDDGIVMVNPDTCIGCGSCAVACPYDQRSELTADSFKKGLFGEGELTPFEKQGYGLFTPCMVSKCDFCRGRVDAGLAPACVVSCPTDARIFGDLDDPDSKVSRLIRERDGRPPLPEKNTKPKVFYID